MTTRMGPMLTTCPMSKALLRDNEIHSGNHFKYRMARRRCLKVIALIVKQKRVDYCSELYPKEFFQIR